jgi:hypothetical protein
MEIEEVRSKSVEVPIGVVLTVRPRVWKVKRTTAKKPFDQPTEARRRPRDAFFATENRPQISPVNVSKVAVTALEHAAQYVSQRVYLNAWDVREEFLSLKSEADFLGFLNRVGCFSAGIAPDSGLWDLKDFKGWQQVFREFLKCSPAMWPNYLFKLRAAAPGFNVRLIDIEVKLSVKSRLRIQLSWQRRSAVIWVAEAVSAILVTIYIDHLRGLRFRFCARRDCRRPFKITSRHKRKYCQQYCAHLESLRRMRNRQRRKHL